MIAHTLLEIIFGYMGDEKPAQIARSDADVD
jgi:hypothetical protein